MALTFVVLMRVLQYIVEWTAFSARRKFLLHPHLHVHQIDAEFCSTVSSLARHDWTVHIVSEAPHTRALAGGLLVSHQLSINQLKPAAAAAAAGSAFSNHCGNCLQCACAVSYVTDRTPIIIVS